MLTLWICKYFTELSMTSKVIEGHKRTLFKPWLTFLWTNFVLVSLHFIFSLSLFSYYFLFSNRFLMYVCFRFWFALCLRIRCNLILVFVNYFSLFSWNSTPKTLFLWNRNYKTFYDAKWNTIFRKTY